LNRCRSYWQLQIGDDSIIVLTGLNKLNILNIFVLSTVRIQNLKKLAIAKKIARVSLLTRLSDNSTGTFSPADSYYKVLADIRKRIDSTLMILQQCLKTNNNRLAIQLIKNYG
jgi:hypothetical protein